MEYTHGYEVYKIESYIEYTHGYEVYKIKSYMEYTHGYKVWPYIGSCIRVIYMFFYS